MTKNIRICYIIGQLHHGGAEKQLFELVHNLDREVFAPIVIVLSQGGFWKCRLEENGIQVLEVKRNRHVDLRRMKDLIGILRSIHPDIVHTYLFPANSYGRIAALFAKVPVIISSERNPCIIGKDKRLWQVIFDLVLSFFTKVIICNSEQAVHSLEKYFFPRKKLHFIHNGLDIEAINTDTEKQQEGRIVVGTVGRMVTQKNFKLFLDVAKKVSRLYREGDLSFWLIGEGPCREEFEKYALSIGLEERVSFLGDRDDVPDLMSKMDIFVSTSFFEGISNVIMEAMASGLPVVATDVGGNRELITHGDNGFLCGLSVDEICGNILRLIEDTQERKRMGENNKKRIQESFSVNKMVSETCALYRSII